MDRDDLHDRRPLDRRHAPRRGEEALPPGGLADDEELDRDDLVRRLVERAPDLCLGVLARERRETVSTA